VNKEETEAEAATAAVVAATTSMVRPSEPIEIKVDRPFLYAIRHVPSGICLFLGRATDAR
jgi:serpin B